MPDITAGDARIRDFMAAFAPEPGHRPWYGGTSLFGTLRGVSAEQAAWRAPGHDHSLWQLLLHCAYSRYTVRRAFVGGGLRGDFPRRGGYWASPPGVPDEAAWRADRELLKAEHERLIAAVAAFSPRTAGRAGHDHLPLRRAALGHRHARSVSRG